jgi:Beta-ketoacyl synthase, C-terminal domain
VRMDDREFDCWRSHGRFPVPVRSTMWRVTRAHRLRGQERGHVQARVLVAVKRVFGAHAWRFPCATKALHGHHMSATGAVETLATLEALRTHIAPPTLIFHPDPGCDLDYVSSGARELPRMRVAISNSSGFGGSNAVIVARRYQS